jgi:hypothetical protein
MEPDNIFPSTNLGWMIICLTIIAFTINIVGIKKNKGKGQKIFTWILWAILDGLLFLVSEEENSHCLFLIFINFLCSLVTIVFLLKYKNWEWGDSETVTLIITPIFIFFWIYSGSGSLGIFMAVVVQLIAGWPLMKESWENPESGFTLVSYITFALVYLLAIIEAPNWELQNMLFPGAFFIYTLADTYPLLKKWHQEKYYKSLFAISAILLLLNKKFS